MRFRRMFILSPSRVSAFSDTAKTHRAISPPSNAALRGSFDNLVGAELDRSRQFDADRLGGFEVDDQLEFDGLLNWEICGLRPVEYLTT